MQQKSAAMSINTADYRDTMKHMVTGQSWKVVHKGCSDSRALKITMEPEGYLFYCFKCQGKAFVPHEDTSFRDRKQREAEKAAYFAAKDAEGYDLPIDWQRDIPDAGLAWLGKGGWTNEMICKYGPMWSSHMQRVLFTIKPIGYIARAVFEDQVPKYLTKGPKKTPLYWTSEPIVDRVCLTEDILSAGKVGRVYPAMAGLGTDGWNLDIILNCREVLIWTDNDAGGEHGRKVLWSTLQWLPNIKVLDIRSKHDPKAYSTTEIIQHLETGGASV